MIAIFAVRIAFQLLKSKYSGHKEFNPLYLGSATKIHNRIQRIPRLFQHIG